MSGIGYLCCLMTIGDYITDRRIKWIISFLILVLCLMLGAGLMQGILYVNGIEITDEQNLISLLDEAENRWVIRMAFGFSHIAGFILSSLLIGKLWDLMGLLQWKQWFKDFHFSPLSSWLLLLVLCYPMAGLLGYLAAQLPLPNWLSEVEDSSYQALEGLIIMENVGQLLGNLLVIAIIPAIGEEMFFRGVVQGHLQKKYTHSGMVIFLSAFIFAAFHLQFVGFFPKLIIGLVLAASYFYTRNLIYPILIHLLNNGFQVVLAYIRPEQVSARQEVSEMTPLQVAMVLLTVPLIGLLFQYIIKNYNHGRSIKNEA